MLFHSRLRISADPFLQRQWTLLQVWLWVMIFFFGLRHSFLTVVNMEGFGFAVIKHRESSCLLQIYF